MVRTLGQLRHLAFLALLCLAIASPTARAADERVLFTDAFDAGLGGWEVHGTDAVRVRPSGDAAHGHVLELTPNGDVLALIRGSERWAGVRLEGEMRFPTDVNNYLGLAWGAARTGARWDFGLIYVKGNDGYLQLNPHRDFNVSRLLYPEFRTTLRGPSAVETGVWQRFAIEVVGADVHVYVGATTTPQMTYRDDERREGRLGLQPRSIGGAVWVDNVTVRAIDRLSYGGPAVPEVRYAPDGLVTAWQIAGPFTETRDDVARRPGAGVAWRPVATDARGAVVTGRDVDTHGPRTVAYYRAHLPPTASALVFATIDDLTVWVNGHFEMFVPRQDAAWHDVHVNAAHAGFPLALPPSANGHDVVVRVRGGAYASGGFFARAVPRAPAPAGSPALAPDTTATQAVPLPVPESLDGVAATTVTHEGRSALRLIEVDARRRGGLALLSGPAFTNGTITLDVAGRRGPHAVPDDRGFIGVAFRVRPGASAYEYVYIRPDNGRAADQVRRNHATQYASFPGYDFDRFRKESPERYESYADMVSGAWTRLRIEVEGTAMRLFVGDASQPALVVSDLKQGVASGRIALWIGPGTEGFFRDVSIEPR